MPHSVNKHTFNTEDVVCHLEQWSSFASAVATQQEECDKSPMHTDLHFPFIVILNL